ncbi:MAG TPA: gamma-glutamyltransferase, partial [Burkholderiaceae bacterium]|nr:gamma-glutamyltransferase [Burkholderiaceae bacterium]
WIIAFVAKVLLAHLHDGLPLQQAIALPNFGNRNGPTELERDRFPASLAETLRRLGHEIERLDLASGVHAIARLCDPVPAAAAPAAPSGAAACRLVAGVDPRREGVALGR